MFEYLPFLDSFDHYSSGDMTEKWTTSAGGIVPGRTGNCFGGLNCSASKTLSIGYSQVYAGLAYKTYGFANAPILLGSMSDYYHLALRHVGDGRFQVQCGYGGPTSPPSEFVLSPGLWYSLQLACIIENLGGNSFKTFYEAKVNEATILAGNFTRTIGGGFDGLVNIFTMTGSGGGVSSWFDDVCILEDEFPGDVVVMVKRPRSEGDWLEFSPNVGVSHWAMVDDGVPDGDSTYLFAAGAGLRETHRYEPTGEYTIRAIQTLDLVDKVNVGTASLRSVMVDGSSAEHVGPSFYPSEASWLYNREGLRKSPFTGLDWTPSELDAIQRGSERVT
jgi:hypothetical protein